MQDIRGRYEKVLAAAEAVGQGHVLRFWDELADTQREGLVGQLEALDFARIDRLVTDHVLSESPFQLPQRIDPAPCYPSEPASEEQRGLFRGAWQAGEQALGEGMVCAFTVAGGMGTRLGHDGPKGFFPIGPVTAKPLFQLFAEYIVHCRRRYNEGIRWYIMTSRSNHRATVDFFKRHDFFGLDDRHVIFFEQGMMPAFSPAGKILLDRKDSLALSPDGHGGSLRALRASGALDQMAAEGVQYISYFQVDNPLVRCLDPHFIGLHILDASEMSSKAVPKAHDTERVGNFAIGDGKLMVIEYSDLPAELATAKNADGTRRFDAGSIAIHIISRDFVERITKGELQLPYHRAVKTVAYVDDSGVRHQPDKPNAVKLEQFVFDAIPLASNPIVVQTARAEEFSPVKNADGPDSPATSRRDLIARAGRWLEAAGVVVARDPQTNEPYPVEISPCRAIFADDLK